MELLAFSGYARSGKDEAARTLARLGYERLAFADVIREFLYRLNPILEAGDIDVRVKDVIDRYTWNGYKNTWYGKEIRALLQRLGVESGRNLMGENIWVDSTLNSLDESRKYVITDCRFVNEANAIRARGGKIYRILRVGVGPANSHISETSLDDYDFDGFVTNDSTLEAFRASVLRVGMANIPNSRLTLSD